MSEDIAKINFDVKLLSNLGEFGSVIDFASIISIIIHLLSFLFDLLLYFVLCPKLLSFIISLLSFIFSFMFHLFCFLFYLVSFDHL